MIPVRLPREQTRLKPVTCFSKDLSKDRLTACPDCDLLMTDRPVHFGQKSICPRCGSTLKAPKENTVERTLALSLTGLLLFLPAMLLPVMRLSALGLEHDTNLVHGISTLFASGFHMVAVLVLLTGVAVPLVKLVLLFYVSLSICFQFQSRLSLLAFRAYHEMDEWGMLEIYMLGILVSIIKLKDLAELSYDMGLACFSGLLLITLWVTITLDSVAFWRLMDREAKESE